MYALKLLLVSATLLQDRLFAKVTMPIFEVITNVNQTKKDNDWIGNGVSSSSVKE